MLLRCLGRESFSEAVKEADTGYPSGPGCETDWGVLWSDASERVDRRGGGGKRGGMEGVEALARDDDFACDGLLKHGAEEDEVCMLADAFDFSESVAGDGDNGRRNRSGGVEFADLCGA
jgi:hypothetical protein